MSYTRNVSKDFDVYKNSTEEELKKKNEAYTQAYEEWNKQRSSQFFYAVEPSSGAWKKGTAIGGDDLDLSKDHDRAGCKIS